MSIYYRAVSAGRFGWYNRCIMKRWGLPVLLVLFFIVLFTISVMTPIIPLSYDEAWNYTNISSKGPMYAITNFPFANNHVFFTLLQSVTVPRVFLPYFPEATRLLNVAVGIAFFLLVSRVLTQILHKKSIFVFVVAVAACFFCSPLVTPFFIVARGYLLGMALLFSGIYIVSLKRYTAATILFILSGWTVTTYIYCLPLIYLTAFFISKRGEQKRVFISAVFAALGLYIVYKPILFTVLSQGALWNTASPITFFRTQWNSLSYISYLPVTGAYVLSLIVLFSKHTNKSVSRFFMLLTSSIAGYLIVVELLSLTGIAHPPYERAGMFIPVFITITLLGAMFTSKSSLIKYLLLTFLGINTLAGIYFSLTGLPFHREYLSPTPYPVSLRQRQLLTQKKLPYLTVTRPEDEPFFLYFSQIYSVPVLRNLPSTPSATTAVRVEPIITVSVVPNAEPLPSLLPTSRLYILKRLWQYMSLPTLKFITISPKYSIEYLIHLSDMTYAEGDILWRQGAYDLSLKTLARAEHDVTLTVGPMRDYLGVTGDTTIVRRALSSVALHQHIIMHLIITGKGKNLRELLTLASFANRNLQTILSFLHP